MNSTSDDSLDELQVAKALTKCAVSFTDSIEAITEFFQLVLNGLSDENWDDRGNLLLISARQFELIAPLMRATRDALSTEPPEVQAKFIESWEASTDVAQMDARAKELLRKVESVTRPDSKGSSI